MTCRTRSVFTVISYLFLAASRGDQSCWQIPATRFFFHDRPCIFYRFEGERDHNPQWKDPKLYGLVMLVMYYVSTNLFTLLIVFCQPDLSIDVPPDLRSTIFLFTVPPLLLKQRGAEWNERHRISETWFACVAKSRKLGGKVSLTEKMYTSSKNRNYIH